MFDVIHALLKHSQTIHYLEITWCQDIYNTYDDIG